MKVQIEGSLYIESDGMQFIIKDYTGSKDKFGKDIYKTVGYYTNLQSAIKAIIKQKVMDSTATNLKELLNDVKQIESFVEAQVLV